MRTMVRCSNVSTEAWTGAYDGWWLIRGDDAAVEGQDEEGQDEEESSRTGLS